MRALVLDMPESWLDERARKGLDSHDELWEGVLHMVPPPGLLHQRIGVRLCSFLAPRLLERGIEVLYEVGVFRPGANGKDYRVPDLAFLDVGRPELQTDRGLEGAPRAILEIRSANDETYDKFDFWAQIGVPEIVVILPQPRVAEIYRLAGDRYVAVSADHDGCLHAASIDVRFVTMPGEPSFLRVHCSADATDI